MTDDSKAREILLVEDSFSDEELTLRMLRKHGVANDVVVARSGQEALDYLFGTGSFEGRDASVLPLVMLLDLRLPEVDGVDVLRGVRADPRTKSLAVIVLTGSLEESDTMKTFALHASSFLQKPLGFDAFLRALLKLGLLPHLKRQDEAALVS
jgi:two-component system response regulator